MAVLVTVPKVAIGNSGTTASSLDFIVSNSIDYGLTRVGGPILYYDDDPDLSGVQELCIVGHGAPGQIESRSAQDMANKLTKGAKALPDNFRRLIITSCYAGVLVGNKPGTAVIDVIAKALGDRGLKGIEVSGAMGPSIKANELGNRFRVVSDTGTAGPIQNKMVLDKHLGLPNPDPTKGPLRYTGTTSDPKLAEQAAKMMAKISGEFYKEFVDELEQKRTLFDEEHAMRTVLS